MFSISYGPLQQNDFRTSKKCKLGHTGANLQPAKIFVNVEAGLCNFVFNSIMHFTPNINLIKTAKVIKWFAKAQRQTKFFASGSRLTLYF